ncbi:MAG: hypothetical protein JSW05_09650 [Candidatus Thorarchaeota archaeon]|nr:MAG: hypothetical protein JSW05_09650 [Candidatus Thorarchaeota archaeon]
MYSFERLAIRGHRGLSVPNTLRLLEERSDRLAVVFPGRGYTAQAPLLYYTISSLLHNGINVLSIDYQYIDNPVFESLERDEQMKWLYDDVESAYEVALDEVESRLEILVGKSLGTIAIGRILDSCPESTACKVIWHTPLLLMPEVTQQIEKHRPESIFVIGTADPHYDENILARLVEATNGEAVVVDDANHAMEVPGGVNDSLWAMERIVDSVGEFVGVKSSQE